MSSRIYIRPVGRLPTAPDRAVVAPGGLRVGDGDGDEAVFASCEIIERFADDRITRRLMAAEEIARQQGAPSAPLSPASDQITRALSNLAMPRAAVGGLSLARPRVMGIVNVTPDSFSDGGRFLTSQDAIAHGLRLASEGADILDIGGESTRPGAAPIPLDEELRRVMPVIEGLRTSTPARLSIDTRNAEVMRRAATAGVHMLNDVSALTHDPQSLDVAARTGLPVVLMHAQGTPETMQREPKYKDALLDVFDYLEGRIETCERAGIARERLIVDPGIGFGKTVVHNLEILAGLSLYHTLGVPVMLGASRKRFIGALTGADAPADRVMGSVAAALAGVMQGVQILRVHDVAATRQALTVWEAAFAGRSLSG